MYIVYTQMQEFLRYLACKYVIHVYYTDAGKAVIGLDGKNWFAFEVPMNLADLLQCGRRAVSGTVSAGLRGRLGRLTPAHREFLAGMNRFLIANTHFNT